MKLMKFELRKATIEDCRNIYRWRTDPINSEGSFTGGSFTYNDHKSWFADYLEEEGNLMLIASFNDVPCCVLRFDKEFDERKVSIYMVPGYHGCGLGLHCLLFGERYLKDELEGSACSLGAEIMCDNDASMRLFKRAGYVYENVPDASLYWYKVI